MVRAQLQHAPHGFIDRLTFPRLSLRPQSAPEAGKLSSLDSFERCPDRASRLSWRRSPSWPTAARSTQSSSRTMCDSSTSRSTSSTWCSSPTASPTSSKTSIRYTCSPRSSPAPARRWTRERLCEMPTSCSAHLTSWSRSATERTSPSARSGPFWRWRVTRSASRKSLHGYGSHCFAAVAC